MCVTDSLEEVHVDQNERIIVNNHLDLGILEFANHDYIMNLVWARCGFDYKVY